MLWSSKCLTWWYFSVSCDIVWKWEVWSIYHCCHRFRTEIAVEAPVVPDDPELVVLDEHFNFLDPTSQNILKNLILEYNKETGATIIISSHNLSHTVEISTRIALLENGEIIRDMINDNNNATVELEQYFEVK